MNLKQNPLEKSLLSLAVSLRRQNISLTFFNFPSMKLYKSFACCLSVWACIGIVQLICRLQNSPGNVTFRIAVFFSSFPPFCRRKNPFRHSVLHCILFDNYKKIAYYCNPILGSFYMTQSNLVYFFNFSNKLNHILLISFLIMIKKKMKQSG